MRAKPKLNIKNIRKLQQALKDSLIAKPTDAARLVYDQDTWSTDLKRQAARIREMGLVPNSDEVGGGNVCGTACCLAGTAVTQMPNFKGFRIGTDPESVTTIMFDVKRGTKPRVIPTEARKFLGLSADQSGTLFAPASVWPAKYGKAYRKANNTKQRTRVAIKLLDAVVKTRGKVLETTPDRRVSDAS